MQALRSKVLQSKANARSGVTSARTILPPPAPQRSNQVIARAILESIPDSQLIAGGVAAVVAMAAAGLVSYQSQKAQEEIIGTAEPAVASAVEAAAPAPLPRENAVMVLGATGRLGRRVVQRLLAAGRTVVAGVRSGEKAEKLYAEAGITPGRQPNGKPGVLFIEQGLDVTNADTLKRADLWQGVSQVVLTLGGVFGPMPGGGFGVIDGMSSERVEGEAIPTLMQLLPQYLKPKAERTSRTVLPMATAEDLAVWEKLDDVIMGGNSGSALEPLPAGSEVAGAKWKGELVVEGGGFCGTRTKTVSLDFAGTDGIHLRVKGDGSIFKMNIKTTEQLDVPESTYQTTFDTVAGQWADVYLPWHSFVPVKRAQSDPKGAPLDPSKIAKFGLVLSRFEFNKNANPLYKPGPFELLIEGGIRAYTDVRPQVVLVSSAGVERNAIIADDDVARIKDIPIVQLNPGGTLNHKYSAETAVRNSGYPYTVMRGTGMIDSNEGGPFLLEADQGDTIVGQLSRDEASDVLVAAVSSPEAAWKTFEVRRNEGPESKGVRAMEQKDYLRMFLKLSLDRNRWRVGLAPFPKPTPPPAPVTEERRQEILAEVARIRGQQAPAAPAGGNGNGNGAAAPAATEKAPVGAKA